MFNQRIRETEDLKAIDGGLRYKGNQVSPQFELFQYVPFQLFITINLHRYSHGKKTIEGQHDRWELLTSIHNKARAHFEYPQKGCMFVSAMEWGKLSGDFPNLHLVYCFYPQSSPERLRNFEEVYRQLWKAEEEEDLKFSPVTDLGALFYVLKFEPIRNENGKVIGTGKDEVHTCGSLPRVAQKLKNRGELSS